MTIAQRIPLSRSLSGTVAQGAAAKLAQLGKALPGHVVKIDGGLVTVAFDVTGALLPQVQMPVACSEYSLTPIAVGDKGVAIPADAYIGGVSGLGTGNGDLSTPANLSALIWFPVSNSAWELGGTYKLTDATGASVLELTSSGITLTVGSHSISITSSGIMIDDHSFINHQHTGVTTGTGDSGGVNPAGP